MTDAAAATPKEQFDVLFGLLKDSHKEIVDFEFKQATFLALVAGWFITSGTAREFLSHRSIVAVIICVILLTLTVFHAMWVWQFKVRSDDAFHRMGQLSFMREELLAHHTVTHITSRSFIFMHSLITLGICAMILTATLAS